MLTRRRFLRIALTSSVICGARAASADTVGTLLTVAPFAQTKSMDCWLAAAVMMVQWKNAASFSEMDVATMAGPDYISMFNTDTGLNGTQFAAFATALGMVTEAPQNFTPGGYNSLLTLHGPLWVGSRLDVNTINTRRHIRVLRGITGDGTFDGSTAWVLDPDGGRDYQESVTQFAKELEQIAIEEIGSDNELYPQIIHFP